MLPDEVSTKPGPFHIAKTEGVVSVEYQYDGLDVVAEYDATRTLQATYLFGPGIDEPLKVKRGTTVSAFHTDGLGSVVAVSDAEAPGGDDIVTYEYDAFGRLVGSSGTSENVYTYTGRERDASGLYYYRARYYLAEVGRFLTPDPMGLEGGANPYVYVSSNPVNFRDPFGLAQVYIDRAGPPDASGFSPVSLALWGGTSTQYAAAAAAALDFGVLSAELPSQRQTQVDAAVHAAFSYVGLSRSSLPADWQFVYDPMNPGLEPAPRDYAYSIPGLTVFGNAAFSSPNVLVGTGLHELQHAFDYQEANADVIYGYPQWDMLTEKQTREAIHAVQEFRALTTELEFIRQRGGYPESDRDFVIDRQQYWRNQVQRFTSPDAVLSNPPRLRRR